ncbi:PRC-barrel domain-containing protein [Dyadobacter psychrotolerans]|uniref:PRC-barrel domain containing protein n=1 Tax=Dyadobacter psychrotolerans TaxID=2541721 RepID=A0A4R5DW44_9BACT|nr:PRC-barrel domain-containing protein [Dyadobacter psychrotolerans]TDE18097.1 PRC-barrel domain containing protein [Dyadobacter psychrotolerans]
MKRSLNSLIGYTMRTTDGDIGEVKEFYFDDQTWTIRYLIVETGSWFFGRKVLISPEALTGIDSENSAFDVNITKEQVKTSPDIDTDMPVYRQQEEQLFKHYPWSNYWFGSGIGYGTSGMMAPMTVSVQQAIDNDQIENGTERKGDSHLRSTAKTIDFKIHAEDGQTGTFEDLIIEDASWQIKFLVVDMDDWKSDKKVLITPAEISQIKHSTENVIVKLTVDELKNSPDYDPTEPVNEVTEKNLRDYYGRLVSTQ